MAFEIETQYQGKSEIYVFTEFPIVIGRDGECDLQLPPEYHFVSRKHARLDRRGPYVVLIDNKSKNGVLVGGRKIEGTHTITTMDEFEFQIEGLRFIGRELADTKPMDVCPTSVYADQHIAPEAIASTGDILDAYRAARTDVLDGVARSFASLTGGERRSLAGQIVQDHPELLYDPAFQTLLSGYGISMRPQTLVSDDAQAALDAVRDIAATYVLHASVPMAVHEIKAFMTNVGVALQRLLEGKIRVDDVLGFNPQCHSDITDAARELGRELLDWEGDAPAAVARVELDYRTMIDRHHELLDQRDATLRRVLVELSPRDIEWTQRRKTRWQGWFRPLSLYPEFVRRYQRISTALWGSLEKSLSGARGHEPPVGVLPPAGTADVTSHHAPANERESGPRQLCQAVAGTT